MLFLQLLKKGLSKLQTDLGEGFEIVQGSVVNFLQSLLYNL